MKNITWHNLFFASLILILVDGFATTVFPMPTTMYVRPQVTYLRDGPSVNSQTLVELRVGDQVEATEATESGWVKVRSVRTDLYGWLPKDMLVATPPASKQMAAPAGPHLPKMYVAVKTIEVKEEPQKKSKTVKELQFKDKVEKLDENKTGWYQVRVPGENVTGWVPKRSLEAYMLSKPSTLYRGNAKHAGGADGKKAQEKAPSPDAM